MKKRKIFEILTTSIFSFGLIAGNCNKSISEVSAADAWTKVDTRVIASSSAFVNGSEAYTFVKLSISDYTSMPSSYAQAHNTILSNYSLSDYNFKSKILFSSDNINYVAYSDISNDFNFLWGDSSFRLGFLEGTYTYKQMANFKYIKIEEGCEFPSYAYCSGGSIKTKYVQSETTISTIVAAAPADATSGVQGYKEYKENAPIPFAGIAIDMWNNTKEYSISGYRDTIFAFGTWGVDFFSNSHVADATNRGTSAYDIGRNLKMNGVPFYKICQQFPSACLSYAHGNNYLYIRYPEELLLRTDEYLVPEVELVQDTDFVDGKAGAFKVQLIGDKWIVGNFDTMRVENPIKVANYAIGRPWPLAIESTDPYCVATGMPSSGGELAITFNIGNDKTQACNLLFYNLCLVFMPEAKIIQILETPSYTLLGSLNNFQLEFNTDYILEIISEARGNKTYFKVGINHAVIFDQETNVDCSNLANGGEIWTINPGKTWSFKDRVEIPEYKPTINVEGTSVYDFMEGDELYDFESLIHVSNLYSDTVPEPTLTYDEGAVSNGKYNAGNWKLTISVDIAPFGTVEKVILINVHGDTSYATICFGDYEPIRVKIGSFLEKPKNPTKASDDDHDYVFDGWYFEGAKWNFETDIVRGDMYLEARFTPTTRHYNVVVNFEGFEKLSETYRVNKGTNFSFVVFEETFAESFTVFEDGVEITSLVVTKDTTLTVVYHLAYEYHPATPATCDKEGTVAYYTLPIYEGYYFADPEGHIIINNIHTPKLEHSLQHLDAKDSTCLKDGNVDCYYCPNCDRHYSDSEGTIVLSEDEWKIAKKPHAVCHHEAHEETCTEDGNIEYWTCDYEPGIYFADETCTETLSEIVIESLGHRYYNIEYKWGKPANSEYVCTAYATCLGCGDIIMERAEATKTVVRESTCSKEGEICYSVSFRNPVFNAQTKLIKVAKLPHTYVFVEEISATETSSGIKAHYECSECGGYFLKNGESYVEVKYNDLIIPKIDNSKKGCKGSLITSSLLLSCSLGAGIILLSLKKKEEK